MSQAIGTGVWDSKYVWAHHSSRRDLNISGQYLQTDSKVGYVAVDVDGTIGEDDVREDLRRIDGTIRVRFLY